MKRQAESEQSDGAAVTSKRRALDDSEAHASFRAGLFEPKVHEEYRSAYAASEP